jgi:hypothetical protein
VQKKGEVHTGFEWGNMKERGHLKDLGVDGRIILKWIFNKWDGELIGLFWLRIGTGWLALVNAVMNIRIP